MEGECHNKLKPEDLRHLTREHRLVQCFSAMKHRAKLGHTDALLDNMWFMDCYFSSLGYAVKIRGSHLEVSWKEEN